MNLSRRRALALGSAFVTISLIPIRGAFAVTAGTQVAIDEFTGGAEMIEGGIVIDVAKDAENGSAVPIKVDAPGATSIIIIADGNPNQKVVTFNFGELSGSSKVGTRIRLAKTQNVIIIAKMSDGSFKTLATEVNVALGGC